MKQLFFILVLITVCFSQNLNIIVKTNTYNGQASPKHALAIWVQNPEKNDLVKTLLVCSPEYNFCLKNWRTAIGQKDTNSYNEKTHPTITNHDQSIQALWDCKDINNNLVAPGLYELCIEFTENKHFWKDTNEIYSGKFIKKIISIDNSDEIIMKDSPYINFKATYSSSDLIFPLDNAMGVKRRTDLVWKKNPQALSYNCQVSTNPDFSIPVETYSIIDTFRTLKNLNPSTKYYWRIKALNSNNTSDWFEKRSFNTAMAVPLLLAPVNDTSNLRLRNGGIKKITTNTVSAKLVWNKISCSFYDCQISTNANFADFSSPVINHSVKDTFLINNNLDLNNKYYWRVRAVVEGVNDTSDWSDVWSFITTPKINIKIYDKEGRTIYSYSDLGFKKSHVYVIKKSFLKKLYLIKFQMDDSFYTIRFLKSKKNMENQKNGKKVKMH